ncbi:MAG TPA: site-2 protease family protein [Abditibacteriaceae bacterium]|jgi:Zn-dependent protease
MGWQDRKYSGNDGGNGFNAGLMQLLTGSVSLGVWFGIAVRIHITLILYLVFSILGSGGRGGMSLKDAATSAAILFGIVLLHEFGHCIAARKVGGDANEILLWPLGGLAYIRTPQRPWPSFVGTAGGPLVNVLICAITGLGLLAMSRFQGTLPLNPLASFGAQSMMNEEMSLLVLTNGFAYLLFWIYNVSWTLLFFNLLPIFPLDGGRILQTMLWPKLGFYNSMNIACIVGMAGAVLMGIAGLAGNFFLFFLGVSGFLTCYQTRQNLPALSEDAWRDSQYTARAPGQKSRPRNKRDDDFSIRDLNPIEKIKRARRKKQFQRLFEDDDK